MNNLQKAIAIELPRAIEAAKRAMDNAKTDKEYWEAAEHYLFLVEQKESLK